jgi:protein O-GlcNAc transferase
MTLARALAAHRKGRLSEAEAMYADLLKANPNDFTPMHLLGVIAVQTGRASEGVELIRDAIRLDPKVADAHSHLGNGLRELRLLDEALRSYERAIALNPKHADALHNRGIILWELNRPDQALASFDQAIQLKPKYLDALYNNRGIALWGLKRWREALDSFQKTIELNPNHLEAHNNCGAVFLEINQLADALASFNKAIALKPDYVDAYLNRAKISTMERRFDASLADYDYLFRLDPTLPGVAGHRLHAKMQLCDWRNFESEATSLIRAVRAGLSTTQPFFFLAVPSTAEDQLQCSRSWVATSCHYSMGQVPRHARNGRARIHVAYVSADFRQHPMSFLMAGLFEHHDRSRFEITGVSLNAEEDSDIYRRVKASFERFICASSHTDGQLFELLRTLEIDVLVDLMGFTTNARTAVIARKPAPVQVNYLGYPGTMGAPFIDYIIADRVVIPEDHRSYYSEKVVFMPHSYCVNDSRRIVSEACFSREELGLPSSGFVFCCFNNPYKISPRVFDSWMRILRQVPDSIIWLLETSATTAENLRKEAVVRGVDARRLVFAKYMPQSQHLARLRVADLCLDTLPYNAHTTASDALWAGTPVLTCIGDTFAGRVAASMLWTLQLPELVTSTQRDYEKLAVELATQSDKLADIKCRLAKGRTTSSFFDTRGFTKHLEKAFEVMSERYRGGSAPIDFSVSS